MPEAFRMWFEIAFTLTYLVVLWYLVITMKRRLPQVDENARPVAQLHLWAFSLLALGDSPHILGRIAAYALGGLDATPKIFGTPLGIVGLGALATSITLTVFYALMLVIWHNRFEKPYGWFEALLFVAAIVRLVIMIFPGNQWQSPVSPHNWAIYRNIPFLIQGLGIAFLFWRDGRAASDKLYISLAALFLFSFAFYTPVVLFAHQIPIIGMLMLPKTFVYGLMAYIVYRKLFA
ncbi:MAG TPA: hypothetical protein EYP88_00830 [Anaerolineales bacterium]|nr:hypothetical protein [Anaerolineales bacterium]